MVSIDIEMIYTQEPEPTEKKNILECNKVKLIEVYKFTQSIKRKFYWWYKVIQIHLLELKFILKPKCI